MKSQTSLVAQEYRLQEWGQMIQACKARPKGMTVDEWCQSNSISKANYYYRMQQVRKALLEFVPDSSLKQEVVPVRAELMTMSENVPEEKPVQPVAEVFLEREAHGITLRVTEQTPNKLLSKVLGVLAHVN